MATETSTESKAAEPAAAEPKPQRRRITRRKQVEAHARAYFEALARRDPEGMVAHWREDGVEDLVAVGVLRGTGEIAAFFRSMFAAAPDLETTVVRVVAGEREAAVEWRMAGHFTGAPFLGIEPTGRRFELRGLDLLEIEKGRIASNTAYYDGAAFARQVGMLPAQDSGAERAMKKAFNAVTKLRRAVAERTGS